MEVAEGISLENFVSKWSLSPFPLPFVLDYLHNTLNKTQLVRGTIFDLLTSQVRLGHFTIFYMRSQPVLTCSSTYILPIMVHILTYQ